LKTFVEYIRPSRKSPEGISSTAEVTDRDIHKLDIPRNADFFYFYESDETGVQAACSPLHIVAVQMLTREEAKELLAPNLTEEARRRISWDPRLEQNALFALTRNNNIEVVTPRHIVIDSRKNQLYPPPAKPLPKATLEFNAATSREIRGMKPVRFRPLGPKGPQP